MQLWISHIDPTWTWCGEDHTFRLIHVKKTLTLSPKTVAIPNIDVKFWTKKSEFPQGDLLHSLTQSEITKQRPFEPTDIEYDGIKDEISRI